MNARAGSRRAERHPAKRETDDRRLPSHASGMRWGFVEPFACAVGGLQQRACCRAGLTTANLAPAPASIGGYGPHVPLSALLIDRQLSSDFPQGVVQRIPLL